MHLSLFFGVLLTNFGVSDAQCTEVVNIYKEGIVDYVAPRSYSNCNQLKTLIIHEGITLIGNEAFMNCANLVSVTLPNSLEIVKYQAFIYCSQIQSLVIPEGVKTLENSAFRGCASLTSVSLPSTLENLEIIAFQENMNLLTSISFPNGNDKYKVGGNGLFIYMTSGELIMCSNSVTDTNSLFGEVEITNIATHSFIFCNLIQKIVIPNTVKTVESRSMYGMNSLTSVHIGSSVSYFDSNAIDSSYFFKQITVDENSAYFTSFNDVLFSKDKEKLIIYPIAKPDIVFEIPKEMKSFEWSSVFSTKFLNDFKVPNENDNLQEIEGIVFSKDGKRIVKVPPLKKTVNLVEFQKKYSDIRIETIDVGAFYSSQIQHIDFPDTVNRIETCSFMLSNLNVVIIPENVLFLGNSSFYNCYSLTSIEIRAPIDKIPGNFMFQSKSCQTVILPQTIKIIDEYAFLECRSLVNINLPQNLLRIEKKAFYYCINLPDLVFPESLKYIGISAFESCLSLKKVMIPKNVEIIDELGYSTCTNVELVTMMNCNTIYMKNTFYSIPNYVQPKCIATKTFTCKQLIPTSLGKNSLLKLLMLFVYFE